MSRDNTRKMHSIWHRHFKSVRREKLYGGHGNKFQNIFNPHFPLSPYPLILIRTCSLFQNNPLSNLYQPILIKSQHKQCLSCGWNAAHFLLPGFSNLLFLLSLLPELQLLCAQASLMKGNLSLKGLFR